jgi:two-component system OmpR family response regulator
VEDESSIRNPLQRFLEREGYRITAVSDAASARAALADGEFQLAILDIMMPGEDGLSLARWIRSQGALPILFLSARAEDIDRIIGLEIGGDDYLTKPFNPRELLARVRAILRRSAMNSLVRVQPRKTFTFGPFRLDCTSRTITHKGSPVPITAGEFRLLQALVERPGRTLSREQLLDLTQGRDAALFDRAIDNAMMRLRKKLGPDAAGLLQTSRGFGYSFNGEITESCDG